MALLYIEHSLFSVFQDWKKDIGLQSVMCVFMHMHMKQKEFLASCGQCCVWLQDQKAAFVCELQQVGAGWRAQVAAKAVTGGER